MLQRGHGVAEPERSPCGVASTSQPVTTHSVSGRHSAPATPAQASISTITAAIAMATERCEFTEAFLAQLAGPIEVDPSLEVTSPLERGATPPRSRSAFPRDRP